MAFIYSLADTWNDGATTFTGIGLNVTDTASSASSLLMDLQVGGTSQFSVERDGDIRVLQTGVFNFGTRANIRSGSDNNVVFGRTSTQFWVGLNEVVVAPLSGGYFGLGQYGTTVGVLPSTINVKLYPEAAGTLAQRNGTNAQTFNLYGTYTDASNLRRLVINMSAAGVAEIKPNGLGTGVSGNVLHISGLPTANPGPGILWNNAGTVEVGT